MFDLERAWAAGFLDAEGHFRDYPAAQVAITQVDLESIDVFAHTVGVGVVKGPYEKATANIPRKPQYVYYAYGQRAKAVFELVAPWLGAYRWEQALKAGFMATAARRDFEGLPFTEQIAWCGGFFEGEGCFNYTNNPGLQTRITNTDIELLERFRGTVGIGRIYGPYAPHRTSGGKSPQYAFSATGFENMQAILAMLWPWLSSRRRVTAMSLLEEYRTYWKCGHRRGATWKANCPICWKPGPKPGLKRKNPQQLTIDL